MHTLKGLGGTINSLLDTMDPVQSKLRSKKIIPLTPVPNLHYPECTLFPQKLMEDGFWCIKEPSKGEHPTGLSTEKQQQKVTSSRQ